MTFINPKMDMWGSCGPRTTSYVCGTLKLRLHNMFPEVCVDPKTI